MEAINELFERGLTEIFRLNIIHAQVCKILEPLIFPRAGKPCLIDKNQLRMNCGYFTANGARFHARGHGRSLSHSLRVSVLAGT